MNLREEFYFGKKWVLEDPTKDVSTIKSRVLVADLVMKYLGSLLSSYALTRDGEFLKQAIKTGHILKRSFDSGRRFWSSWFSLTHILLLDTPNQYIVPSSETQIPDDKKYYLSELANQLLEYRYLADLTNDSAHKRSFDRIQKMILVSKMTNNLYSDQYNSASKSSTGLNSNTISFYWILLDLYLQCNDTVSIDMYEKALGAIEEHGLIEVTTKGYTVVKSRYLGENETENAEMMNSDDDSDESMSEKECTLAGMFATFAMVIASGSLPNSSTADIREMEKHWTWAKGMVQLCHTVAINHKWGLFPALALIREDDIDISIDEFSSDKYRYFIK